MRVISGSLKGRKINFLKNYNTRPLKDSVRESIFNILDHSKFFKVRVKNSNILDLYSGIGSFGIESLSRGAAKITFIEQDKKAAEILERNLMVLSVYDRVKLINNKIEIELEKKFIEKFSIFFFDPPFVDNNFIKNLKTIKIKKIYKKDHLIIIHRERKADDNLGDLIKIVDTKIYGRSKIIFGTFNWVIFLLRFLLVQQQVDHRDLSSKDCQ